MAAFSSNIDITSGGTYGMDVTNGESSLKVANDLNGKMANIQQYLQNGLPEVWTGDSLPDSLPDGKIIVYNGNLCWNNNNIVYNIGDIKYGSWTSNRTTFYTIKLDTMYNVFFVSCRLGYSSNSAATTVTIFCTYNNKQDSEYNYMIPTNTHYSSWTKVFIHIDNTSNNRIKIESGTNGAYITDGNWILW